MNGLDRAKGALLGLAIGDAVGTTLEFKAPGRFTPIADMVGGGPFHLNAGEWTDDTSMALCLAESILDTGAMNLADQLRRYLLWKDTGYLSSTGQCFDIGNTTRSQLERFRHTTEAIDPHPDEDAAANGSLMRLAAVPIRWHSDPEEASERSAESSRSTHPAALPVDCCRLLGAMVSALIGGASYEAVTDQGFWNWGPLHPEVEAIADGSWKEKQPPAIRGSGYCVAALEAALWAVHGASDFGDAVLRAANLGDDADTTAAIAAQLAGARWGASTIPESWRDRVVQRERIESLALRMYQEPTADRVWPFDEYFHAWWVEPGRFLAGEFPGHQNAHVARQKIDIIVDAGIRTFVDLTMPEDPLTPYESILRAVAAARDLELHYLRFPIPDVSVIADDRYGPILTAIGDSLEAGGVFVHCWGGVGRTSTVVGCYLADQGLDYDGVIERLTDLRRGTRKAGRAAPETSTQCDVIKRRVERRGQES